MDMTVEELIAMLEMQKMLQFNHFTNEDAWELGNIMVAEARDGEKCLWPSASV